MASRSIVAGAVRLTPWSAGGTRAVPASPPAVRHRSAATASAEPVDLLGRETEAAAAEEATAGRHAVEVVARCGYGRTAMLRSLAASVDGAVLLGAAHSRVPDVLQQVVQATVETDEPHWRPDRAALAGILAGRTGPVLVDEVGWRPAQAAELVAALPACAVVLGASRPVLAGRGTTIPLSGLPADAATALFERHLGRAVTAAERPSVRRLAQAVDNRPLAVRFAAALVGDGQASVAQLARAAERDPLELDRLIVSGLSRVERRLFATLALLGGAFLPETIRDLCADAALAQLGRQQVRTALDRLHRRGMVDRWEERYGVPRCVAEEFGRLLLGTVGVGDAVDVLIGVLDQGRVAPGDEVEVAESAVALFGGLARLGDWRRILRLAEVVGPVLCVWGRWDAWQRALEAGLDAARALGGAGTAAAAVALHELGTLALAQEDPDRAGELLEEALSLRREAGDEAGAAATAANLALLGGVRPHHPAAGATAAPPPGPEPDRRFLDRRRSRRRWASWAAAAGFVAVSVLLFQVAVGGTGDPGQDAAPTRAAPPGSTVPAEPSTPPPPAVTSSPTGPTTTDPPTPTPGPATGSSSTPPSVGPRPPVLRVASSVRLPGAQAGTAGDERLLAVTNIGGSPVTLTDLRLTGDTDEVEVRRDCVGRRLSAGRGCEVGLRLRPLADGLKRARLTILFDRAGPVTVRISGTVTPAPQVALTYRAGPWSPTGTTGSSALWSAEVRVESSGAPVVIESVTAVEGDAPPGNPYDGCVGEPTPCVLTVFSYSTRRDTVLDVRPGAGADPVTVRLPPPGPVASTTAPTPTLSSSPPGPR